MLPQCIALYKANSAVLYILFHNSHKILSCSNKIITWEDVTDVKTDTDHYACRIPPKVQHPDALWATEKWREFMWQNHNPGLNTKHPWIHQEKAPLRSAASRLHQLAEEDNEEEQDRNCHGRPNTCWDVPSTDWGNGWYQEIPPVVGKDHLTGLYRGSDHGSTRRGPKIRSTELGLYHSQQDQSYRLPQGVPETIWHIATWGKVQAGNEHNASTTKCLR